MRPESWIRSTSTVRFTAARTDWIRRSRISSCGASTNAITKYRPDVIYFDEHAGDPQVYLGIRMGLGPLAPPLVANYYNKSLAWNQGEMEVVILLKGVGGRYDSFENSPELLPSSSAPWSEPRRGSSNQESAPIPSRPRRASKTGTTARASLDGATQSILGLQTDLETQSTELGGLRGDLTGVRFDIDDQRAGLDRLTQITEAQFTRLDGIARDVTVNAREVDAVRSDMERILAAFEELSQSVRAREGMEMILVTTTGSYQIMRGNRAEAAGSRWGLHWLPVGIPFVAVGGGASVPFTLQQGEPRVFELLQQVR
jgi:hypothetical protein